MAGMKSIKTTQIISICTVLIISQMVAGFMQYRSQAEQARAQVKAIAEASTQPLIALASDGINGGNAMILSDKAANSLYAATRVLYLKMSGMSAGSEKTDYSDAIPPQKVEYEYSAPDQDASKLREVVMQGAGLNNVQLDYVVRIKLPKVKNGGELVAVFSAAELAGLEWRVARSVGGLALIIVFIGVLLALWLGRLVADPVVDIANRMVAISESHDFSVRVSEERKDEVGQISSALNRLVEMFRSIIADTSSASIGVANASKEIAQGNVDLSQRTEEQVAALEQTASRMQQLTSTVKQNAENAKQANQLATSASDVAVKGGQVVNDVVKTMASISDSSGKIVDIISIIEGIAFQTNLLALNAAVEAARAGEQGRGFAVVANEVRILAQRSADASKEIKALIDDSVNKIDGGTRLVDDAGTTMTEIVSAVNRVTSIMTEISIASDEQSADIEQIHRIIEQLEEMTQQNATLVEQAAASTESMEEQAHSLMEAVSKFKLKSGSVEMKLVTSQT